MKKENNWNSMLKLKSLPYGGVHSVSYPKLDTEVESIIIQSVNNGCLNDENIHNEFIEEYKKWILQTKNNKIIGLDNFKGVAFSNGTSEIFDKFYLKHKSRRLRFLKGEYMYHMAAAKHYFSSIVYIDDEPILDNDVVIISYPFANNGDKPVDLDNILENCTKLNVPVLIDCAYINLSGNLTFDFNHPCIEEIAFSLSKTFPVGYLRIGMRLSRIDNDDPLFVYNKNKYVNRIAPAVGLALIKQYTPDYNYDTYRNTQLRFCKELNVDPSPTVVFGTSTTLYTEYNRGGLENRLCFSKFLHNGTI